MELTREQVQVLLTILSILVTGLVTFYLTRTIERLRLANKYRENYDEKVYERIELVHKKIFSAYFAALKLLEFLDEEEFLRNYKIAKIEFMESIFEYDLYYPETLAS